MRTWLLLATIMTCGYLSGCKTAEIAVDHQMTGIHVAAKFEGKDELPESSSSDERDDAAAESSERVALRPDDFTR